MKLMYTIFCSLFIITTHAQSPRYRVLDIEDNGDYSSLQFLDSTSSKFYFTSEAHGIASNSKQFLKVFKYLYDQKNVRTIVLERSHSVAYLLSRYFETADTNYLRKAVWFQDDFDMYVALKKHIQNKKIKIIGNDAERYFNCLAEALLDLSVKTNIKALNDKLLESLYEAVKIKITKNEALSIVSAFKALLKQPAFTATDPTILEHISFIVNNPCFKNGKALYIISERDKYDLLNVYAKKEEQGNYLSQYGAYHTRLTGGRWASLLQYSEDSPFKGSVFSIGVDYFNTTALYGDKETYHNASGNLKKKDAAFFSSLSDGNHFVFFPEKDEYNYNVIFIHKNQVPMKQGK